MWFWERHRLERISNELFLLRRQLEHTERHIMSATSDLTALIVAQAPLIAANTDAINQLKAALDAAKVDDPAVIAAVQALGANNAALAANNAAATNVTPTP